MSSFLAALPRFFFHIPTLRTWKWLVFPARSRTSFFSTAPLPSGDNCSEWGVHLLWAAQVSTCCNQFIKTANAYRLCFYHVLYQQYKKRKKSVLPRELCSISTLCSAFCCFRFELLVFFYVICFFQRFSDNCKLRTNNAFINVSVLYI